MNILTSNHLHTQADRTIKFKGEIHIPQYKQFEMGSVLEFVCLDRV